jgi:5'-methylthioadenosine nucleosidase
LAAWDTASVHTAPDPDSPQTTIERITVLYAMEAEGMPLVERLKLTEQPAVDPNLTQRHFAGTVGTVSIDLLINGLDPRSGTDRIGTDAATLAGFIAIRKFAPDVVINAGTCGGFQSRGGCIGDIYVSEGDCLFHDRHIALPGFELQARGQWPVTPAPHLAAAMGAKSGIISTGNSLDATPDELMFFARHHVVAKDMEACAIAQVCGQCGVPFIAVKAVTDLVDHPEPTCIPEKSTNRKCATERTNGTWNSLAWCTSAPRGGTVMSATRATHA